MIKNIQTSSQAGGFTMPICWTDAASSAAVRTLPAMGGVSAHAAAGTKGRSADVAPVCVYTRVADVFVLEGAFPGTSAWSPPI